MTTLVTSSALLLGEALYGLTREQARLGVSASALLVLLLPLQVAGLFGDPERRSA